MAKIVITTNNSVRAGDLASRDIPDAAVAAIKALFSAETNAEAAGAALDRFLLVFRPFVQQHRQQQVAAAAVASDKADFDTNVWPA